ncbi:hypothetical protein [Rhizobium skierniewicense]|uniref:hypothetical protein n=1 Tax=Rhizobium skierniewicense TaxID=984260 RepID=UPI001572B664|nr:hypothetical protein [Rhizobium skierniewicense]NTF32615.1 hypothetical protein [Rhizobium skierniewicense]
MAKTPSFDARTEKLRAEARTVQELCAQLANALCIPFDEAPKTAFQSEARELAELRDLIRALETDVLGVVSGLGSSTQAAYAAFDKVDEVSWRERFFGFFIKRNPTSFKVLRLKKLVVAEMAKTILLQAAAIHDVFQRRKDAAASLVVSVEPELVASMEERRVNVSKMDDARQRDKSLVASLATLNRKIQDASDVTGLSQLRLEEAELSAEREMVLGQRDTLRKMHDVLDRQAILLGDMIDLQNDAIALHTLLLNKVNVEAERCIQLYDAAFGSLDPLLAEAKPSVHTDVSTPMSLAVFQGLLTLHSQGAITMQDIEQRKGRVDEALAQRAGSVSSAPV